MIIGDELRKGGNAIARGWQKFWFEPESVSTLAVCRIGFRSEEHTSELQSQTYLVFRLLLVTGVQTCALPICLNSSHKQKTAYEICL